MRGNVAHIFDAASSVSGWWLAAVAALAGLLIIEHHIVAGFEAAQLRRRAKRVVTVVAVLAVMATMAPATNAQSAGALLPDLISDPPRASFFKELNTADGQTRLVVTFDGYVHNIGEGALDVVGNPQQADGMKQRVQNGNDWEIVGAPTVRFETDDGHNHFHLIEAIEYVLWNELQGAQTAIGSKVGFCLVDSQQMEDGFEQSYSEEGDNFCQEDNPSATDLRMGITSGWRDIYDATTTLQWVDVSSVTPGHYWIGAITDPNDEILESNEANNELIFSDHTIEVPGFAPRSQSPILVTQAATEFTLTAGTFGTVTQPIYVIEQGPSSGRLDVPVGADLTSPVVRYLAAPGFTGDDEIVFSVHDASSPYPFVRPTQTLSFTVDAGAVTAAVASSADDGRSTLPALTPPSTFFETTSGDLFSVDIAVSDADGGPARLFATGLPAGLVANSDTGAIAGIAREAGIFDVELMAVGGDADSIATQNVTVIVNPAETVAGLAAVSDQSSPRGMLARVRVGAPSLGLVFDAEGLPPGLELEEGSPVIAGTPTNAGSYDVTVRQFDDDEVVGETTFTWTIRPTTAIDFAL